MGAYLIRRLLLVIPTLWAIITINFFIVQIAPGGPVDQAIAAHYKSGQTQKWYEEFLVGFGLDPRNTPAVMKEMLGS